MRRTTLLFVVWCALLALPVVAQNEPQKKDEPTQDQNPPALPARPKFNPLPEKKLWVFREGKTAWIDEKGYSKEKDDVILAISQPFSKDSSSTEPIAATLSPFDTERPYAFQWKEDDNSWAAALRLEGGRYVIDRSGGGVMPAVALDEESGALIVRFTLLNNLGQAVAQRDFMMPKETHDEGLIRVSIKRGLP
jgi:hypothetical protein